MLNLVIVVALIVFKYLVFQKAGEAGWQAIVPIWSDWILCKISKVKWCFWVRLIASILMTVMTIICFVTIGAAFVNSINVDGVETQFSNFVTDMEKSLDEFEDIDIENISPDEQKKLEEDLGEAIESVITENNYDEMILNAMEDIVLQSSIPFIIMMLAGLLCGLAYFVTSLFIYIGLSKAFGQPWYFALGLCFIHIVFIGILALDESMVYEGNPNCKNEKKPLVTPQDFTSQETPSSGEYENNQNN